MPNLAELLSRAAQHHGDRVALKLDDQELNYAFLNEGASRIAGLLSARGVEPGDRVGMIGFFPPLVPRVRALGLPLTVVELRAELVKEEPGLTVTLDPKRLAACNKIVSTSTVLLNDTLEEILSHCGHAEELALIGPSASCFPDPLFARGVTTLGGYWVLDPATFMRRAEALEPWGDAGKKSSVRRSAYPGTTALLREAARQSTGSQRSETP